MVFTGGFLVNKVLCCLLAAVMAVPVALLGSYAHALYQLHRFVDGEPLAFTVVRNLRQALGNEFYPAAVEERSVTRYSHKYRPTAVI